MAEVVRPDLHLEAVLSLGGHAHMSSSFSDFYPGVTYGIHATWVSVIRFGAVAIPIPGEP